MNKHPIEFFKQYNITPRSQQIDVVEAIHREWNNYKCFALSLPTGVGKTFIATSIADSVNNAYMLTSTLSLQDQYMKSWPELINLKGRGNYTCAINTSFTVDAAPCAANPELYNQCKRNHTCPYINQKTKALASKAMITNPIYLLYSAHCGFANDEENPWVERSAVIFDEAHNIEAHLVSFSESDIDPQKLHQDFGVATNGITFTGRPEEDYVRVIEIRDVLMLKAAELKEKMEQEFPKAKLFGMNPREWAKGFNEKTAEKVRKLNSKMYQLDKSIQPLNIFFNTHSTPDELVGRWIITKQSDANILKLAPIYGDFLFREYFGKLGQKFVFLSATLGTKKEFCKELGIDESECLFIETDSPFKPELSPIIVMPSIKLSREVYDVNVKKIGGLIDEILNIHLDQRGLIHSVTYDIAKHIYQGVTDKNRRRLLCRDMDVLSNASQGANKYPKKYKNDELLEIHELQGESYGSVLLSPSMMEGIDLHDDLSMFQVIVKLPFANLGDIRVKMKSKLDPDWYTNKLWLSILQASGRSTRHEEDTSVTYILDSSFQYFFKQWESRLPKWFKNRLVF
jgi:ATP-dependent DNA helicase DinG